MTLFTERAKMRDMSCLLILQENSVVQSGKDWSIPAKNWYGKRVWKNEGVCHCTMDRHRNREILSFFLMQNEIVLQHWLMSRKKVAETIFYPCADKWKDFFRTGLMVWHLYALNAVSGLMNTVQQPASEVAMSLIIPEEYYQKTSGLRSLSRSLISILNPLIAVIFILWERVGIDERSIHTVCTVWLE